MLLLAESGWVKLLLALELQIIMFNNSCKYEYCNMFFGYVPDCCATSHYITTSQITVFLWINYMLYLLDHGKIGKSSNFVV